MSAILLGLLVGTVVGAVVSIAMEVFAPKPKRPWRPKPYQVNRLPFDPAHSAGGVLYDYEKGPWRDNG